MNKAFSYVFLEPGDKVLIVHRRLFADDNSRYFVGRVDAFNEANGLLKVTGLSFVESRKQEGKLLPKSDARTKIMALTSGTLIVYQLPMEVEIGKTELRIDAAGRLLLTGGGRPLLDLSEYVD